MGYKQLYINGIGTGDYGIYISSDTYLNAPAPDITAHQVPGRNGDLIQWNKRLNNIARKFTCYIPDSAQANFDEFKRMLYSNIGYVEISSDYEPETYQRGYLADEIESEPFQSDDVLTVTFTLYFSCEPQKYFKSNAPQTLDITAGQGSNYMAIIPRSHKIVQDIFKAMPSDAIPSDDYFIYCQAQSYQMAVDSPMSFRAFSFNMDGYEGFVAAFFVYWGADVVQTRFVNLIGYSNYGDLDHAQLNLTASENTATMSLLFPVGAVGSWSWAGTSTNDTRYTASGTLAPRGQFTQPKAIGIHYVMTIGGTYGNGSLTHIPDSYDKNNYMVIKGSLGAPNRKQTIDAMITIDATPFHQRIPAVNTAYDYTISIDTETMEVTATFNGETFRMADYVNISGQLEGMADELTIWETHETLTSRSKRPLWMTSISIEPKWWTI